MATKSNPGKYDCYAKADMDEPIFTLRAKDPLASFFVAAWVAVMAGDLATAYSRMEDASIALSVSGKGCLPYTDEKSVEAQQCSKSMMIWSELKRIEKIRERLERPCE